jgi:putative membrane protein
MTYLSTLPQFLTSFVASMATLAFAIAIYVLITPIREFSLIATGNAAAAISFAGAVLGLVIPIASVVAHSRDLVDLLVWSLVALVVQLAIHLALERGWRDVTAQIEKGSHAHAIVLAVAAIAVGVLNAACLTT